jgi:hypothetical protein
LKQIAALTNAEPTPPLQNTVENQIVNLKNVNNSFRYTKKYARKTNTQYYGNVVHKRVGHPSESATNTSKAYAQQRSLALQHKYYTLATV